MNEERKCLMKGTEETYSEGGCLHEEGTFELGPERSQSC